MNFSLSTVIREKFLQYYPEEDLKLWFDPLILSYPQLSDFSGNSKLHLTAQKSSNNSTPNIAAHNTMPNAIQVDFPHSFFAEWFKNNFKQSFENCLAKIYGQNPLEIIYAFNNQLKKSYIKTVAELNKQNKSEGAFNKLSIEPENTYLTENSTDVCLLVKSDLGQSDNNFNFDSFLFNRKNEFPVAAAQKFAMGKGQNIFILYGANSSGKTHLLHAIYKELKNNISENLIFFSTLQNFKSSLKKFESPLLCFASFKYILLEDIHNCAGKPDLQENLALLFEFCDARKINLAVTTNEHPSSTALLPKKLKSIMESALVLELKKPDLDIRRKYVVQCCDNLNLNIKKEDAFNLARMYSDFRQIHGAILKISEFKELNQKAEDYSNIPLEHILKNSMPSQVSALTPDRIVSSAAAFFDIEPAEITGKSRKQDVVTARHICMYLCRELLGAQFGTIGSCFSGRDHSSVLYSVNKIKDLMQSNNDTNNMVTKVKNMCLK
ncbi:hypothetical protein LJB93_01215 [Desulfovibrio sp. OttesenSCG-928-F07]|nr:hypothetical protein [Desulfovibrio sp. OttesenSCG-928-F07]